MPGVGVQRQIEPHPQGVGGSRRDVGVDIIGLDPRVLHPGHPTRQVVVRRGTERGDAHGLIARGHHRGDQIGGTPFAQRAEHRTVCAARDLAEHRIGGLRGDAGTIQGHRVHPEGVVVPGPQHHRPVGDRGVEPAGIEESALDQAAVVGGADNPVLVRVGIGVCLDLGDDLVDRTARAHLGPHRFQPAVERMGVPVAERRHQESAAEVDAVIGVPHAGLCTDRRHHAVGDQQRIGGAGSRPDRATAEQGAHRAASAADGCCWVMQWIPPPRANNGRASTETIVRPGYCSARMAAASASRRSPKLQAITAPLTTR